MKKKSIILAYGSTVAMLVFVVGNLLLMCTGFGSFDVSTTHIPYHHVHHHQLMVEPPTFHAQISPTSFF